MSASTVVPGTGQPTSSSENTLDSYANGDVVRPDRDVTLS